MNDEILDTPDDLSTSRYIPKYLRFIASLRLLLSFFLGGLIAMSCWSIINYSPKIMASGLELRDWILLLILLPIFQLLYFVRQMVSEFLLRPSCYNHRLFRIFSMIGGAYFLYLLLGPMIPSVMIGRLVLPRFLPDSVVIILIIMSVILIIQDGIYLLHNWRER